MKISEIMKTGNYIPVTFGLKGKAYEAAYPFPLLNVDLNDERILITAPLQNEMHPIIWTTKYGGAFYYVKTNERTKNRNL